MAHSFWILPEFFARGEDLFVIPALIVFLQGPVEGSKLALDDKLSDNCLVPILRSRVDPLQGEIS